MTNADIIERNRILSEMDIDAAQAWVPGLSREAVLVGMHKARYECPDIARDLRHESGEWLRSRGYGRTYARPLLPMGDLPE